jgi:hypothetical protein
VTTEEMSIRFRTFPGCPNVHQEPAYGKSILTIPKEHPHQGRVVAVRIDGVEQRFRMTSSGRAVVNFFRLEGNDIHVVCLRPSEPLKLPQDIRHTYPAPSNVYGLQRQIDRELRGPQWVRQSDHG